MELVKTALDLVHLLGLALSFGLVVLCDFLLLSLITRGEFNDFQYSVLARCSRIIAAALQLLILSGLGYLFYYIFNDQRHLLSNPKLIAKEVVVIILCINGYWLHQIGMPLLKEIKGQNLHQNAFLDSFRKLIMMGAISSVSWWTAFVLGVAKILNFKFSTEVYLSIYLLTISSVTLGCEIFIYLIRKKNSAALLNIDKINEISTASNLSDLNFIENVKTDNRPDGTVIDRGADSPSI